jgi:hypothetical protein
MFVERMCHCCSHLIIFPVDSLILPQHILPFESLIALIHLINGGGNWIPASKAFWLPLALTILDKK